MENLMEILADQLDFLEHSATAYDNGFNGEIIRQAISIRSLIDDTKFATSLLTRLGRKNIEFLDSRKYTEIEKSSPYFGLLESVEVDSGQVGLPWLDNGGLGKKTGFDDWWEQVVIQDEDGKTYNREAVVRLFAGLPIGEDIDMAVSPEFEKLESQFSFGLSGSGDVAVIPPESADLYPTMRQITHEVLKTIKLDYACRRDSDGNTLTENLSAEDLLDLPSFPGMMKDASAKASPDKVGRNDLCPCGSGRKYKKCCGVN